jgi:hypothetical protein
MIMFHRWERGTAGGVILRPEVPLTNHEMGATGVARSQQ